MRKPMRDRPVLLCQKLDEGMVCYEWYLDELTAEDARGGL